MIRTDWCTFDGGVSPQNGGHFRFCANTAHDEYDPDAERSAILQLQLHHVGGHVVDRVVTDKSWTVSDGPIRADSTYVHLRLFYGYSNTLYSSPLGLKPAGAHYFPSQFPVITFNHLFMPKH